MELREMIFDCVCGHRTLVVEASPFCDYQKGRCVDCGKNILGLGYPSIGLLLATKRCYLEGMRALYRNATFKFTCEYDLLCFIEQAPAAMVSSIQSISAHGISIRTGELARLCANFTSLRVLVLGNCFSMRGGMRWLGCWYDPKQDRCMRQLKSLSKCVALKELTLDIRCGACDCLPDDCLTPCAAAVIAEKVARKAMPRVKILTQPKIESVQSQSRSNEQGR